jgi:hypothetical protein
MVFQHWIFIVSHSETSHNCNDLSGMRHPQKVLVARTIGIFLLLLEVTFRGFDSPNTENMSQDLWNFSLHIWAHGQLLFIDLDFLDKF